MLRHHFLPQKPIQNMLIFCLAVILMGHGCFLPKIFADELNTKIYTIPLPKSEDPRSKTLQAKVDPIKFVDAPIGEVIRDSKFASLHRYHIVIRDSLNEKRVTMDFKGGTLREFLTLLCSELGATIKYEEYATVLVLEK